MSNTAQRSFAGGELAPSLYARTDMVKYATGLRTCRNFIVQRHGGVANRPGTPFVAEVKDSAKAVQLLEFVFNDDQAYVLEFGNLYMRVVRNGAHVRTDAGIIIVLWLTATDYETGDLRENDGVMYYCRAPHTSGAGTEPGTGASWQTVWYALDDYVYEIPTPYLEAELPDLKIVQSADVLSIVHPSHPPRELSRTAHTRWILADAVFGPAVAKVEGLALSGGSAGAILYWAVTAVSDETLEESLVALISSTNKVPSAGTPTVLTWEPVAGATEYNIYRSIDGATYGYVGSSGGIPALATDTSWSDANEVVSTTTQEAWVAAAGQCRNAVIAAAADKPADGQFTVYGTITVSTTGGEAHGRIRAYYSRDGEIRVDAGILWTEIIPGAGTNGPTSFYGVVNVPNNGYTTLQIDLVPEVYQYTFPGVVTAECECDTTSAPDNRVDWMKNSTGYSDVNGAADYSIQPPTQQALFNAVDRYPSAVAYYQQRQLFANTSAQPEKVWGSRVGSFRSFTRSTPLQDDDLVAFQLMGQKVNAVRHLLDVGTLLAFTQGGVFSIEGDEAGTLLPGAVNPRQRAATGVHPRLKPIAVVNTVLYVQARGKVVRSLLGNAVQGYTGTDLSLFAEHLFAGHEIVDWAFQEIPNSIIWVVRNDGVLLGLTFIPDQGLWGWHRHDTDGVVENVCVIPEGSEESLYLVVRRTIGGVSKRYIERMATRAFGEDVRDAIFVDCGLTYDGRNRTSTTMTFTSATWLAGVAGTLVSSAAYFVLGDVAAGLVILVEDEDGVLVEFTITGFTNATHVTAVPTVDVPTELRGVGTAAWSRAVTTVTGLDHLEGKAVTIIGDGAVEASPYNPDYAQQFVAGGSVDLAEPRGVVHVGLPITADLQTLDIDTAGGRSLKELKQLVSRLGLYVEATRGVWAGITFPATDLMDVNVMQEHRPREDEQLANPVALRTDFIDFNIPSNWTHHGRVCLRQVDPLPVTVLAVIPQGFVPSGG